MKRFVIAILASLSCSLALAAPVAPAVRAEIDALLAKLENSGCQFNRNGSWYSGAEAKQHLLRKLDYLEDKGAIRTTEQFIALAAAKSSSSGKAYQVKCGGEAATDSQGWLTTQLKGIRAAPGSRPQP